ncbi:hypothetical protein LCGC14_1285820, partial [marine sediment metagenome]
MATAPSIQEAPAEGAPSLVTIPHNSATPSSKLRQQESYCPNATVVEGVCDEHNNTRWVLAPCKNRRCEHCGPVGRFKIAQRIALGVRTLWPCSWQVLTFAEDISKKDAVRKLSKFIRWLRTEIPGLQYAATYELTKRGRLHINLIVGPWSRIEQQKLQRIWGHRLWIQWVKEERSLAREVAKSYSPESLGNYLSKLEQAVPTDRRVSFSKDWPKLPKHHEERHAPIMWT